MLTAITALFLQSQPSTDGPLVSFARTDYVAAPIAIDQSSKFKIAFYNPSDKTLTLLRENCSWGYSMIRFEVMDAAGALHTISRGPRAWNKNIPSPFYVSPHETFVRDISFGDGSWIGFPAGIAGTIQGWKVRVALKVDRDAMLTSQGFWVGEVASPWSTATPMPLPSATPR